MQARVPFKRPTNGTFGGANHAQPANILIKCSDQLWAAVVSNGDGGEGGGDSGGIDNPLRLPPDVLDRFDASSATPFAIRGGDLSSPQTIADYFLITAESLQLTYNGREVMTGGLIGDRTYTIWGEINPAAVKEAGGTMSGNSEDAKAAQQLALIAALLKVDAKMSPSSPTQQQHQLAAANSSSAPPAVNKILFAFDPVVLGHIPPLDRTPEAPQRVGRTVDVLSSHTLFGPFTGLAKDYDPKRAAMMTSVTAAARSPPSTALGSAGGDAPLVSPTAETIIRKHLAALRVPTRRATPQEIYRVHDQPTYEAFIERGVSLADEGPLSGTKTITDADGKSITVPNLPTDVYCNGNGASQKAVLASCGLAIDTLSAVLFSDESSSTDAAIGPADGAFALIRPPGHHCGCKTPNGFCLVNNVVVAVKALLAEHPNLRVAIVDCDVHHGEGTQSLIEDDPRVLFYSTHRCDNGSFFPYGTGKSDNYGCCAPSSNSAAATSTSVSGSATPQKDAALVPPTTITTGSGGNSSGAAKVVRQCMNVPFDTAAHIPEECHKVMSDIAFEHACEQILLPALDKFQPDVVVVSCGFDSLYGDPLGRMAVTPNGYRNLIASIQKGNFGAKNSPSRSAAAGRSRNVNNMNHNGGGWGGGGAVGGVTKVVAVLEGGYNSEAVSFGIAAVYGTLLMHSTNNAYSGAAAVAANALQEKHLSFTNPIVNGAGADPFFSSSTDGKSTASSTQAKTAALQQPIFGTRVAPHVLPQTWAVLRAKQQRAHRDYCKIVADRIGEDEERRKRQQQQQAGDGLGISGNNTEQSAAADTSHRPTLVEPIMVPTDDILKQRHLEWVEEMVGRVRDNHPFLKGAARGGGGCACS